MPFDGDPLAFYGKRIIDYHNAFLLKKLRDSLGPSSTRPDHDQSHLTETLRSTNFINDCNQFPHTTFEARDFNVSDKEHPFLPNLKVGILGAGIGGLYTALILDSLNIKWEILEASGRPGGRLATYYFKEIPGSTKKPGKYDYFDEGAMRYPLPKKNRDGTYKNGTMKRLGDLIQYPPLNQGSDRLKDTLIPYYFKARQSKGSRPGLYYFNGEHKEVSWTDAKKGDFNAKDMGVSSDYAEAGSTAIHSDVIDPFVRVMINDYRTDKSDGWTLVKANDSYSIRGYMASKYLPSYSLNLPPRHLPNDVINWCNLLEDSSGGYDRALTEEVFDAFAFAKVGDSDYGDVEWQCFEGGSETLTKKIVKYLDSRGRFIKYDQKVTTIDETRIKVEGNKTIPAVKVTVNGYSTVDYPHVISTLPLPVLRTINLKNANLNISQKNALRALDYGPAVKVAILFDSNWWTTKLNITGGQSFTDLPIRTIVYPSYGVDSNAPSKVLIASYTWTTDASRLGALAVKENKEQLKELVLRSLAEAHEYYEYSEELVEENVKKAVKKKITYEFLQKEYRDMHVKDWNIDEYAMGGYAKFSPGEFEALYASLNAPATKGCLHFAGEAVSTRHSWVVGALDSAWRAVYEFLKITNQFENENDNPYIKKFKEIWGTNKEWANPSTLVKDNDLLFEHLGLVEKAIWSGDVKF